VDKVISPSVPFYKPTLVGTEVRSVQRVNETGPFGRNGMVSRECERLIGASIGSAQVQLMPSCTAALEMAALPADIRPGDESFRASKILISILQLCGITAVALLYLIPLIFHSAKVALDLAGFPVVSGIILPGAMRRSQTLGGIQIKQSRVAGSLFLDALNGLPTVKAFSAEEYVATNYSQRMFEYVKNPVLFDFINPASSIAPALLLPGGLLVLVLLFPMAKDGALSPTVLVAVLIVILLDPLVASSNA
jgi:hypothetical protein